MTQVKMDGDRKLTEGRLYIKFKISGHRNVGGGGDTATVRINQQQEVQDGVDDVDMDVDDDGGGRYVCPVCEKNFTSEKSLFGHMRCHPDRPWRGIHPPSGYSPFSGASTSSTAGASTSGGGGGGGCGGGVIHRNSSSSALSSNSNGFNSHRQIDIDPATNIDLSQALKGSGWSKTHARCRKKEIIAAATPVVAAAPAPAAADGSGSPSSRGFGLQLKEEDAVRDLMLLAQGPSRAHHQLENDQKATNSSNSLANKTVENGMDSDDEGESSSGTRSPEFDHHRYDQLDYDTEEQSDRKNSGRSNKRRKRTRDLDTVVCITEGGRIIGPNFAILPPRPPPYEGDVIEIVASSERFKCSICSRSFATHQALGGHVSSHNKLNRTKLATEEAPPPPPMDEPEDHNNHNNIASDQYKTGGDQCDPESAPATAAQHSCKFCRKMFFSGQALGGHMRRHFTPAPPPPQVSSSSIAPPINGTGTGGCTSDGRSGGKAPLNFDLNLPAPEEEEPHEPSGNGNGMSV